MITLTVTGVPTCVPAPRHTSDLSQFSGAAPFGIAIEGTSVSRARMTKAGDGTAQGTAARGRPV